jgi:hypothetical protein
VAIHSFDSFRFLLQISLYLFFLAYHLEAGYDTMITADHSHHPQNCRAFIVVMMRCSAETFTSIVICIMSFDGVHII